MIEADAEGVAADGGPDDRISGYSYDEIEAAVLQTESGRAFLAEHARRVRIESELQLSGEFADLRARLAALYRKLDEMGAAPPAAASPRAQPTATSVSVPAVFVRPPPQPTAAGGVPAPYFPPARFNVEPVAGTTHGIPAMAEPEAVDWVAEDGPDPVAPAAVARTAPRPSSAARPDRDPHAAERERAEAAADWFMLQEDPILDTSGIVPPPADPQTVATAAVPDAGAAAAEPDDGHDRRADAQHSALTGMLRRMRRAMGETTAAEPAAADRSVTAG